MFKSMSSNMLKSLSTFLFLLYEIIKLSTTIYMLVFLYVIILWYFIINKNNY